MKLLLTARNIAIILLLCALCLSLLTPIHDADFFWHLATGKWIAEHRELPKTDPFAFTSPPMEGGFMRSKLILSMYWLAQLLQYGVFSAAGYYGIIALRVLIMILTLFVMAVHMRKKGLDHMAIMILIIPTCYVLLSSMGDRPNQMTFLFAAVFMFLLEALRRNEQKGYLLPILFIIWANIHGGFILGAVTIVITFATELLKKMLLPHYRVNGKLLFVLLLTLGAGLLNPAGYSVIYSMLYESSAYYNASVTEARSPYSFVMLGQYMYIWMIGIPLLFSLWYFISEFFIRMSGVKDRFLERCDELLLLLFIAAVSLISIRYIPVFVIVAVPIMAPLFAGKFQDLIRRLSSWMIPELAVILFSCWWIYGVFPITVLKREPVDPVFPNDAVQFIKESGMSGNFYNYYDWGGYLIWQFYPEKFVFIDGRGLYPDVFHTADLIVNDRGSAVGGKRFYQTSLDAYSVRHLLIPAIRMRGDMIYLLKALETDPQWHLIFVGRNSLVYTRDKVDMDYPKSLAYVLVVSNALDAVRDNPTNPLPYLAYAKANSYLGRSKIAVAEIEGALNAQPSLRGGVVERALVHLKVSGDLPVDFR